MKTRFTLLDIEKLAKAIGNASIAHDCLAPFLNSYHFDAVYETEDDTIVFENYGDDEINIEFSDFNHTLKRKVNIMYKENGRYKVLYHDELMKVA